ncbi:MarR family transcriptional regulator [Flavobacterium rivuli WB 3.3-2 = DSM 21788]|uniref:MarR family transcriptional regulator n=1 Tax=Flavobacterium rivuli WB 3.3-2 = DSM 21788 TaxID=1121895 RepID=A0A0A2M6D7_9FLAO|nr:bifunctional helix-turn-helix transcriptional regulator/GNAT family N-acetyltransferase [Flavobacterium rivuli]KGO88197.1 MarR family transcriptional regulator [Flavobacterium rivuli WB 3.3-2 = DSM 21788]
MEFFDKIGKMAIGSRLRMLSEIVTEDASKIYNLYGIDFHPKWFPVYYVLAEGKANTITSIAKEIGHSHPSVSKIISEMVKAGLVLEKSETTDGRRNVVSLSAKGNEVTLKIQDQYTDLNSAIEDMLGQTTHNLWKALAEWEFLLEQKSLLKRVTEQQKLRERSNVTIVDFESMYLDAFVNLNTEWISHYFKMEESDYKALNNAEEYILNNGGYILVALYKGEPLGVCALIKYPTDDFDFELAKMAVSPKAQGKNIGGLLGAAVIDKAKSLGAKKLYLESNTILKPAINLYHKLGFVKIPERPTPYERCNIQMELVL